MSVATTVATVVAWLIAVGIAGIGAGALFWSPKIAEGFGIPGTKVDDATSRSWLHVKADRDIGAGLMMAVALVGGGAHLIGAMMLVATLMPVTDALIVKRSGGPTAAWLWVHAATAAVMAIAGVVLLLA